jgi:hypothetical protein
MSFAVICTLLLFASGIACLAWWSVQNLIQAELLGRCRTVSLAGLVGQAAALRGPVRVHQVLRIAHLGDVLWHREIIKVATGKGDHTRSDTAEMGTFSIVVGGEEVRVAEKPTEVQGPASKTTRDKAEAGDFIFGGHDESVIDEWLPLLEELTVVGLLRRAGTGWEIVADSKAGLLLSRHDPGRAALQEKIKGWLGLAGAAAALAALVWLLKTIR